MFGTRDIIQNEIILLKHIANPKVGKNFIKNNEDILMNFDIPSESFDQKVLS